MKNDTGDEVARSSDVLESVEVAPRRWLAAHSTEGPGRLIMAGMDVAWRVTIGYGHLASGRSRGLAPKDPKRPGSLVLPLPPVVRSSSPMGPEAS
jgi:hypothetical protein